MHEQPKSTPTQIAFPGGASAERTCKIKSIDGDAILWDVAFAHTETPLSHEMMSSTKPSAKGTMQRTEMHSTDFPEIFRKAAKTSTGSTVPGTSSILNAASVLVVSSVECSRVLMFRNLSGIKQDAAFQAPLEI